MCVFFPDVDCTVWHTAKQQIQRLLTPLLSCFHPKNPQQPSQRLLTQALMDANTYEEMEAEESRVLRKAAETGAGEEDVEYGAQVCRCVHCV